MKILVLDVGGTHIKVRATGQSRPITIPSGREMTARKMCAAVRKVIAGWRFDRVTVGYPGVVLHGRIAGEPHHLGSGWVGFDFAREFPRPVRIINDAAMQALGSYRGGRMLFLGLGTGLGSAMIVDGMVEPMELAHLPYKHGRTYEDFVGLAGLKRLKKKRWRHYVKKVIKHLQDALEADYVVLGGGNARLMKKLPAGVRRGDNRKAFLGGCRLWTEFARPSSGRRRHP